MTENKQKSKISRLVTKLVGQEYHLAKAYYLHELEKSFKSRAETPILIYQMGKVGSSTVKRTLNTVAPDIPTYHVHFLNSNRIAECENARRPYFGTKKSKKLRRPWLYQFLKKHIDKGPTANTWKIITLVRDPIARNISAFFEVLEIETTHSDNEYHIASNELNIPQTVIRIDEIQVLIDIFLNQFPHAEPLHFFENEINAIFGIDVYQNGFPHDQGYRIYHNQFADLLLIRLEDMNRMIANALQEFLNIENARIYNQNIAEEKKYARLYKCFKEAFQIPESYMHTMYDSQYMQHFYSRPEILKFKSKWSLTK